LKTLKSIEANTSSTGKDEKILFIGKDENTSTTGKDEKVSFTGGKRKRFKSENTDAQNLKLIEAITKGRAVSKVGDQSKIAPPEYTGGKRSRTKYGNGDVTFNSELNVEMHTETGELGTQQIIEAQKREFKQSFDNLASPMAG